MHNFSALVFLLLLLNSSFSQAQDTIFFDAAWDTCSIADAKYYRLTEELSHQQNFRDFYILNNQLNNTGAFLKGNEVSVSDEVKTGHWIWWFENGQKESEGEYSCGVKVGIWKRWYRNGQQRSEKAYQNQLFDNSIDLSEILDFKEIESGKWTYWHESGQVNEIRYYENSKRSGKIEKWYEDGQIRLIGKFHNDSLIGIWENWYQSGQKRYEVDFSKSPILQNYWMENGMQAVIEGASQKKVIKKIKDKQLIIEKRTPLQIIMEQKPEPLNMSKVQLRIGYPLKARDKGIEGKVLVRVLVNEEGKYVRHKILGGPDMLVQAVNLRIHELEFTPAIQDGEIILFWANVPFAFKLL